MFLYLSLTSCFLPLLACLLAASGFLQPMGGTGRRAEGRRAERGQSYHLPIPYSCSVLIVATSLCNFRTHTKSLLQNSSSLNSVNSIFSPHSFSSNGMDSFSLLLKLELGFIRDWCEFLSKSFQRATGLERERECLQKISTQFSREKVRNDLEPHLLSETKFSSPFHSYHST